MKYKTGEEVELNDKVVYRASGIPMGATVVYVSSPMKSIENYEWLASESNVDGIAIRWENFDLAKELYWSSALVGEMADFLVTDSDDEDLDFATRANS